SFSGGFSGIGEPKAVPSYLSVWSGFNTGRVFINFQINVVAGRRYKIKGKFGHTFWPEDHGDSALSFNAAINVAEYVSSTIVAPSSINSNFQEIEFMW